MQLRGSRSKLRRRCKDLASVAVEEVCRRGLNCISKALCTQSRLETVLPLRCSFWAGFVRTNPIQALLKPDLCEGCPVSDIQGSILPGQCLWPPRNVRSLLPRFICEAVNDGVIRIKRRTYSCRLCRRRISRPVRSQRASPRTTGHHAFHRSCVRVATRRQRGRVLLPSNHILPAARRRDARQFRHVRSLHGLVAVITARVPDPRTPCSPNHLGGSLSVAILDRRESPQGAAMCLAYLDGLEHLRMCHRR